jgi:hypothetical protein
MYQLGVLGSPPSGAVAALTDTVAQIVSPFGLTIGNQVSIVHSNTFCPDPKLASASVYFGGSPADQTGILALVEAGVPIVPVVSELTKFATEVPEALRHINGLALADDDPGLTTIAVTLLECVGLLPRQRRIFLSYRRVESRIVALQLFEAFSARHFDVFLDTHGVPPAEDFQAILWHRLCDSDVLVMLDTPGYFNSRWTAAEFGRALAKSVTVLRLGWPEHAPSPRAALAESMQLATSHFLETVGRLSDEVVDHICAKVETLRSKSIATRHRDITGALRAAMDRLGGSIEGIGKRRSIVLRLPDQRRILAYPVVGVPSAEALYEAASHQGDYPRVVVYDPIGLDRKWHAYFGWLGEHLHDVQCVRSTEAAWILADWGGA